MPRALNHKQKLFVKYYLIHENATKAAKLAGYSEKSAGQIGSELLKDGRIGTAIHEGREAVYAKLDISIERVTKELARLAYSNLNDFTNIDPENGTIELDLSAVTHDQMAAVKKLDILPDGSARIELHGDKKASLDLLLKHLGGYSSDNEQKRPESNVLVAVSGDQDTELARRVAWMLTQANKETDAITGELAEPKH